MPPQGGREGDVTTRRRVSVLLENEKELVRYAHSPSQEIINSWYRTGRKLATTNCGLLSAVVPIYSMYMF